MAKSLMTMKRQPYLNWTPVVTNNISIHMYISIERSANQISIYRFFDLQIKFRSTDCLICKSYFDLQIFRSANQVSIYRLFDLQIKFRSKDFSICTMYYDKIFAIFPKMNLKFTIPWYFEIFGHHHPNNLYRLA